MIIFPETIAPRGAIPQVITASCIENAEPENGNFPRLGCFPNGTWIIVNQNGRCRCRPGAVSALDGCICKS